MIRNNTAVIISDNLEFTARYSEYLQANNIRIKNSVFLDEWFQQSSKVHTDLYVLDNTDGNFPYSKFLDSLKDRYSQLLLLNVGNQPPRSLKTPYLIFTVNPEIDNISLPVFLENADRVLKREKAQSELASMLLHDVRSPLNSLIGYLELILNETFGEMNEGQKNILEKAMEMGDITLDMLEDLNEIFRREQSSFVLHKQPFDFSEVLESVLINIWVKADQKNIQIRKNLQTNSKMVLGDDYQIQRVITNLISNAIKYSPKNSKIMINTNLIEGNFIRITVRDNGQGVPEEHLPHLFDKYYRVKQKKKLEKGFGLGLYICKLIIKAHNGKIWAESNEEGGLSVNFTLPIAG